MRSGGGGGSTAFERFEGIRIRRRGRGLSGRRGESSELGDGDGKREE